MTDSIDTDTNKKLSGESKALIRQLQSVTTRATQVIPQLYNSLRKDGLDPFEARDYIEEMVAITKRQLTNILPDEAKHIQMARPNANAKAKFAEILPQIPKVEEPELEFVVEKVDEYIAAVPREPEPEAEPIRKQDSNVVKITFDPAPIDRDRTQVFIIHYDISTNTIKKYETVGRRTLR